MLGIAGGIGSHVRDGSIPVRRRGTWRSDHALGQALATVADAPVVVLPRTVAGAACVYGAPAYVHTDGTFRPCINTSEAAADCLAICFEPSGIPVGGVGRFAFGPCVLTGLSGGTAQALVFIGASAGALTTTLPSGGAYVKPVGRWLSATELLFAPDLFSQPWPNA